MRIVVVPGLGHVDQRRDDCPGGVQGKPVQHEPLKSFEIVMRSFLVKEGHASPVYDPPDEEVLVSPELRVMTGDVGGQDCCGGNVGDRYEEQNARGESKKPGVV